MLIIGFILLVIAAIFALLKFGIITSPVVGPMCVAFYFLLILSLTTLIYGVMQEEAHVNPRVPTQEQN